VVKVAVGVARRAARDARRHAAPPTVLDDLPIVIPSGSEESAQHVLTIALIERQPTLDAGDARRPP
jgi:hypothetical protein